MPGTGFISPGTAVMAILSGCFLLFFGYCSYRTTIIIYLAVVGGIMGSVIGRHVVETAHPFAWMIGGAVIGVLLAVPVEVFMRTLFGIISGGLLGLAIGAMVGKLSYALAGFAIGAMMGGILWARIGDLFIMAMFALLGAIDVLVGIAGLSAYYGRPFTVGPMSVLGVFVAAGLGTAFQYILVHPPKGPVPEREGKTFNRE